MTLRETIPLRKRKIIKKSLGGVIKFIVSISLLGIIGFTFISSITQYEPDIQFFLSLTIWTSLVVFITMLCSSMLYHYLYWKRYHYDVDDHNITIRKGILAQKEITLPFSRITDVYVDQDLLDLALGIYDVHISTPTQESGLFAHIDGVDKNGSQLLKKMILDKINEKD